MPQSADAGKHCLNQRQHQTACKARTETTTTTTTTAYGHLIHDARTNSIPKPILLFRTTTVGLCTAELRRVQRPARNHELLPIPAAGSIHRGWVYVPLKIITISARPAIFHVQIFTEHHCLTRSLTVRWGKMVRNEKPFRVPPATARILRYCSELNIVRRYAHSKIWQKKNSQYNEKKSSQWRVNL